MKLNNFKELLNKKASNNPNLQLLIKYMRDDYLISHVVESLNKMARSYSNKNPNHSVMDFGTNMDADTEGSMIRDALSHHASHYKAALASGDEKLADSHMKKIYNMMHMSEKLTRDGLNDHSKGKLNIEAVDPKPWERSGYANKNEKSGKFSTDPKGWSRSSNGYGWMRGTPHDSYGAETDAHGHKGAYPLNEIKVNGKYLHIDDIDPASEHVDHVFDSHPIMKNYKSSPTQHTTDKHQQYLDDTSAYHDEGGGMDSYFDGIEGMDGYDSRGSIKPDAIHKPLLSGDDAIGKLKDIMGDKHVAPKSSEGKESAPKVDVKPTATAGGEVDDVAAKLKTIMGNKYIPPKG